MNTAKSMLMFNIENYLLENVNTETKKIIFCVEPKTWDILQKTFAQKLSFTKENYFKILNKAFQKVDIFTKKLILFTQATNNKSSWSVLALYNLESFGKQIPNDDNRGFGAVLFSRRKPPNFSEHLILINKFLEERYRQKFPDEVFVRWCPENCKDDAILKIQVKVGLNHIFNYFEKNFNMKLKENQQSACSSCKRMILKIGICCPLCKIPFSSPSPVKIAKKGKANNKVCARAEPEVAQVTWKLSIEPPEQPEIEEMKKCVFLRSSSPPRKLSLGIPLLKSSTDAHSNKLDTKLDDKCDKKVSSLSLAETPSPENTEASDEDPNRPCILSDDDSNELEDPEDQFYYQGKSGERFPFTKMDIRALKPGEWLNDSVINFYLQYLLDHSPDAIRKKVCLFSSYFYQRLVIHVKQSKASKKNCVRPWKQVKDIFDYQYAALPVNKDDHWLLVIMKIPKTANEKLSVFVLDSMRDVDEDFAPLAYNLTCYLAVEHMNKFQKSIPQSTLKSKKLKVPEVPQQKNSYDCGLFVLEFFEQFLNVLEVGQSILDINFKKWFPSSLVAKKRKFLKNLIFSFKKPAVTNGCGLSPKLGKRKTNFTSTSPSKKCNGENKRLTRQLSKGSSSSST